MANSTNLSVTISGQDRGATAMVQRLSKAMAGPTEAAGRLAKNLAGLGNTGPIQRLELGLRGLGRAAGDLAPSLGALGAAGTIAGIVRLSGVWATFGARVARDAYRVQAHTSALQALQGAAKLSGASAESLTESLDGLGSAIVDGIGGRNMEAVQYFNLLGISMRDASTGAARLADDVLPEVADQLKKLDNQPVLQQRVMRALGISPELLPLLRNGAAGLRDLTKEAERYGIVNEHGLELVEEARKAQVRLELSGRNLANNLSASVAPAITQVSNSLATWLATSPRVKQATDDLAKRIEAWVNSGGLDDLGDRIDKIGARTNSVVEAMGGWGNAATALGSILLLRWLAPVVQITAAMTNLLAIRPAAWLLRLLGVGVSAAAGVGAGIVFTPSAANAGQRTELERFLAQPEEERRRQMSPAAQPASPNGPTWSDRLLPGFLRGGGSGTAAPRGQPGTLEPEIEQKVRAAAGQNGVDPDFAVRIARIEGSRRNGQDLMSPAGAYGTMQLMPGTARDLRVDRFNVDQNIDGGVRYLRQNLDKFGGNQDAAAAAYNAGPNSAAVKQFAATGDPRFLPRETQGYVQSLGRLRMAAAQPPQPAAPGAAAAGAAAPGAAAAVPPPAAAGAAPAAAAPVSGSVDVRVTLQGAPQGTRADVTSRGNGVSATARIEPRMPDGGP